jgi:hypothetical protein
LYENNLIHAKLKWKEECFLLLFADPFELAAREIAELMGPVRQLAREKSRVV